MTWPLHLEANRDVCSRVSAVRPLSTWLPARGPVTWSEADLARASRWWWSWSRDRRRIGRVLAEVLIAAAMLAGYERMRFETMDAYRHNPLNSVIYMEK